jgi:transcription termination factor NusB
MRVAAKLDSGAMFARTTRAIGPDETSDELEDALAVAGAHLLVEVVDAIAAGTAHEEPQDERLVTYAARLTKEEGLIDWTQPAGAFTTACAGCFPGRTPTRSWTGGASSSGGTSPRAEASTAAPGTVLHAGSDGVFVAAGDGRVLALLALQVRGRPGRCPRRNFCAAMRSRRARASPAMIAPARVAAFRVLREVARGDAQPASMLAREHRGLADPRDRALTTEIVTGTLRWQRALDAAITAAAARGLDTVHADVLLILRLSLYQLLHLDRVPAAAVVDDAVSLARTAGQARATGFVNGVLRTLSRTRDRLARPSRPGPGAPRPAALHYLGVAQSHPDWLAARWLDALRLRARGRPGPSSTTLHTRSTLLGEPAW